MQRRAHKKRSAKSFSLIPVNFYLTELIVIIFFDHDRGPDE